MGPRRRGRSVYRAFERTLLGAGMSLVAFFIERRLVKAIKKGGIQAAPRTAAEADAYSGETTGEAQTGELTTHPER